MFMSDSGDPSAHGVPDDGATIQVSSNLVSALAHKPQDEATMQMDAAVIRHLTGQQRAVERGGSVEESGAEATMQMDAGVIRRITAQQAQVTETDAPAEPEDGATEVMSREAIARLAESLPAFGELFDEGGADALDLAAGPDTNLDSPPGAYPDDGATVQVTPSLMAMASAASEAHAGQLDEASHVFGTSDQYAEDGVTMQVTADLVAGLGLNRAEEPPSLDALAFTPATTPPLPPPQAVPDLGPGDMMAPARTTSAVDDTGEQPVAGGARSGGVSPVVIAVAVIVALAVLIGGAFAVGAI